jgi:hypothetical protein
MTTIADIADDTDDRARYTALADAAKVVASPQLRNQGTIAGNLCQKPRCWYYRGDFDCLRKGGELCYAYEGENQHHCIFGGELCFIVHPSDTAPALAALGAVCRVSGPSASRSVPVDKLHVPPSETRSGRPFSRRRNHHRDRAAKARRPGCARPTARCARAAWDFAAGRRGAGPGLRWRHGRSARVFLSGAAPIPWRAVGRRERHHRHHARCRHHRGSGRGQSRAPSRCPRTATRSSSSRGSSPSSWRRSEAEAGFSREDGVRAEPALLELDSARGVNSHHGARPRSVLRSVDERGRQDTLPLQGHDPCPRQLVIRSRACDPRAVRRANPNRPDRHRSVVETRRAQRRPSATAYRGNRLLRP